ncbi:MAG: diacylglycerol/polyprenol kinase family protein [Candidatus Nanoarchaeia archaeon]
MELNLKSKIPYLELKRKILHVLGGITGIILLEYNIITPFFIFALLILGIFTSILSLKYKIPIINYFLENFEREKDKRELPGRGVIFAFAGILLALELFNKEIAIVSLIILTFADSTSYVIGMVFGKTKSKLNKEKNIEGPIAGALLSTIIASFIYPFYLVFPASLASMLFELITIKIQDIKLDDNLIIPLVSGTTMLLILKILF